jgi:SAM-dependent methyltransferase
LDIAEAPQRLTRRHPWESARVRAIANIIATAGLNVQSILDYGCGDSYTGTSIAHQFGAARLVGFDIHLDGRSETRLAGTTRVTLTNCEADIPRHEFDFVLLCDVLEHVESDRGLLDRITEFCKPGAGIMITVPAFPAIFSQHDRAMKHHRRYRRRELLALVQDAGLDREGDGYLFGSLLLLRTITKMRELVYTSQREAAGIGHWRHGPVFTHFVESMLDLDNRSLLSLRRHKVTLPGLSAWVLCQTRLDGRVSQARAP